MKLTIFSGLFVSMSLLGSLIWLLAQNKPVAPVLSDTTSEVTGKILFVSDKTGDQEIYMMDISTLQAINLTSNPASDMNPQVTSDGRFMIFYSDRDGDNEIYQMNLENQSVVQLTHNNAGDYDPSYSPDNTTIVFKSTRDDGYGDIFVMQPDGSGQKNITAARAQTEEWDPTFSSDGKSVFFVSRMGRDHNTDELFVTSPDGSTLQQLTNNTVPDWYPTFRPNSDTLAFISNPTPDAPDALFISSTDLKDPKVVKTETGGSDDPSWSLDGEKLIFVNNQDGDYDLFSANPDGTEIQKIADTAFDELAPIYIP